jgi:hypothetical protein
MKRVIHIAAMLASIAILYSSAAPESTEQG